MTDGRAESFPCARFNFQPPYPFCCNCHHSPCHRRMRWKLLARPFLPDALRQLASAVGGTLDRRLQPTFYLSFQRQAPASRLATDPKISESPNSRRTTRFGEPLSIPSALSSERYPKATEPLAPRHRPRAPNPGRFFAMGWAKNVSNLLLRDRTRASSFKDAFRQQGLRRVITSIDKAIAGSRRVHLQPSRPLARKRNPVQARFLAPDVACQLLQHDTTRGHTREFRPSTMSSSKISEEIHRPAVLRRGVSPGG
jgi:hypothetical protein